MPTSSATSWIVVAWYPFSLKSFAAAAMISLVRGVLMRSPSRSSNSPVRRCACGAGKRTPLTSEARPPLDPLDQTFGKSTWPFECTATTGLCQRFFTTAGQRRRYTTTAPLGARWAGHVGDRDGYSLRLGPETATCQARAEEP